MLCLVLFLFCICTYCRFSIWGYHEALNIQSVYKQYYFKLLGISNATSNICIVSPLLTIANVNIMFLYRWFPTLWLTLTSEIFRFLNFLFLILAFFLLRSLAPAFCLQKLVWWVLKKVFLVKEKMERKKVFYLALLKPFLSYLVLDLRRRQKILAGL